MVTVALAVLAGGVAGLAAPAAIERIPAGRFPTPGQPTRPRAPIDWAVAAAVAGIWGVLAAAIGPEPELPAYLYLGWIAVVLAVIDVRHRRLPDLLVLPSYPIALALLGGAAIAASDGVPLTRGLAGALALGGFYYLIAFIRPGGIGLGDVKLAGLLGLYLGWTGWATVALGTVLPFFAAAVVAAALIAARRAGRTSRIPFGPFMIMGALIAIALGS